MHALFPPLHVVMHVQSSYTWLHTQMSLEMYEATRVRTLEYPASIRYSIMRYSIRTVLSPHEHFAPRRNQFSKYWSHVMRILHCCVRKKTGTVEPAGSNRRARATKEFSLVGVSKKNPFSLLLVTRRTVVCRFHDNVDETTNATELKFRGSFLVRTGLQNRGSPKFDVEPKE